MTVNHNSLPLRLMFSVIFAAIGAMIVSFIIYFFVGPWSIDWPVKISFTSPEKPIKELTTLVIAYLLLRYGPHWRLFDTNAWFKIFLMGAGFLGIYVVSHGYYMGGDAGGYYAWLRSIVFDGDIHFANDYRLIFPDAEWETRKTPLGFPINKYGIGVAVYEIPGLIVGYLLALLGGFPLDGWVAPFRIGQAIWLIGLGLAGLWLLYRFLSIKLNDTRTAALLTSMVLIGTNTINYYYRDFGYAHVPSLVLQAGFLYLSLHGKRAHSLVYDFLLGLLLGWMLVIRPTNALLFPFLAIFAFNDRRGLKDYLFIVAGFAVLTSLQLVASYSLWGTLLPPVYPGEGFTSGYVGVISTLISDRHGLFVYHPWYAVLLVINLYGAIVVRSARYICCSVLITFVFFAITNGMWSSWWFGASFGNRSFIETLIPLSVGAGFSLTRARLPKTGAGIKWLAFAVIVCFSLNLYTWYGFLKFRYDHCGSHTLSEVFLWPAQNHPITHCADTPGNTDAGIAWPRW